VRLKNSGMEDALVVMMSILVVVVQDSVQSVRSEELVSM